MKVKETLFIICVLVCMILAISSINAADSDINVIASANGSSEVISTDIQYDENLNSIENEEILGDDDGSFSALNDLISGASENDVIELTHDYIWSDSDVVTNGTVISKTLTINGNNHIIDAKGNDRIFRITGANVVLKDIIFINGKATKQNIGQGGAIWWDGANGTVNNCTFKENTVVSDTFNRGSAGAIWWVGANGTLTDSTFIKNSGDGHNEAGAVYWNSVNGLIQNTKFIDNYHSNLGGALYIGENGDNTNITGCTFINNTAGRYGGAIGLHHRNYLKITDCNFTNNTAEYAGGGIYYNYPIEGRNFFEVDNCSFIGNTANGAYEITEGTAGGGAIYTSKDGIVNNSVFINNKAPYYSDGALVWMGNVEITQSVFINNTAKDGEFSTLTLFDGKIENSIILTNNNQYSVFLSSSVIADYNWWGNTADNYNIKAKAFGLNINKWYYLDVLPHNLEEFAYVTLYNVYDSQTKEKYSAEYECELPKISFDLTAQNMAISDLKVNSINGESDKIYWFDISYPATITVKNGNIEYTKVITLGDFDLLQILIENAAPNDVIILSRNYTYSEGLDSMYSGIDIDKPLVIDGNGFTIDAKGNSRMFRVISGASNIVFKNINFVNGYSGYGGAIALYNPGVTNFEVNNCTFVNNYAWADDSWFGGGAICLSSLAHGNFNITSSKFISNGAVRGGAIFSAVGNGYFNANLIIYNSTFDGNYAEKSGDALYLPNYLTSVNINYSIFTNNYGDDCVIGYMAYYGGNGIINNSIFLNNDDESILYVFNGDCIADNNWWGSTADNYTKTLTSTYDSEKQLTFVGLIHDATVNNWLFLNATIDPSEIIFGNEATVRFFLQSYNPSTGEISDYDMSNIPSMPLSLISRMGYTDEYHVLIGEDFIFHPTLWSNAYVRGSNGDVSYQFNFTVKDISLITLTQDTYNLVAGNSLTLSNLAKLSRSGNLKYDVNDTSVAIIVDGKLKTLKSGIVKLIVTADSTDYYAAANANITIIVKKDSPSIFYNKTDTLDADSSKQLDYRLYHIVGALEFDYDLIFESTNTSIVTVNQNGVITGIIAGTAEIIIKYPGDEKYESLERRVTVTVNKIPNKLESNQTVVLEIGQSGLLEVNQDSETALTFISADENIALVDADGRITAVKGGVVKITITAAENEKYLSNTTTVMVSVKKLATEIDNDAFELTVDETFNISDLTNIDGLTFKSNDTSVASVSENGIITAVGGGVANITLNFAGNETHDAFNASLIITVKRLPSVITLDSDSIYVTVDRTEKLTASLSHEGDLDYEIENTDLITYENGVIKGLISGKTKIIITFAETGRFEGATKEVYVTVNRNYPTIRVNNNNYTINIAPTESKNIEATVNGNNPLTYESSDESIVTISEDGTITALKEGEANITVRYELDEKYHAYSKVVLVIVKKITPEISAGDINILINETAEIDASLNTEGELTYAVGDESIISLSQNGLITPSASGKTNVTIMFAGNDKYAALNKTIFVTVNKMTANINAPDEINLVIGDTWDLSQYVDADGVDISYIINEGYDLITIEKGIITAVSGANPGYVYVNIIVNSNENYNYNSKSVKVNIKKLLFNFNIENTTIELELGQNLNIKEYFNIDADVSLTTYDYHVITIGGDELSVDAVGLGSTGVNILFSGNNTHQWKNIVLTVNVTKISSNISADESIEVNITESKDLGAVLNHEGTLTYTSNDTSVVTVDENGQITAIKAGSAKITISYAESENYTGCEKEVTVTVTKFNSEITYNEVSQLTIDDETNINAQNTGDGALSYESSNPSVVSIDNNGKITALAEGTATITVKSGETENYAENIKTFSVKVNKKQVEITVNESFIILFGDTKDLEAVLSIESGSLKYLSNNQNIVSVDENGKITGIGGGSAIVSVTFEGNEEYAGKTVNVTVTVNRLPIPNSDNAIDLNNPEDTDSPTYSINLPADATGTLTVEVDGKTYTADVVNGTASITVPGLSAGEHDVSVTYSGDSKYPSISKKTSIYVPEIKITKNKDINMLYTSGGKYSVQVTKDSQALAGVTVTFTVNGKPISAKTDSRGYASVKINLPPRAKAYEVTAEYKGVKVTNKVKVTSIIKAKNIKSKKTKKVLKIKISLKKVNKKYLKGKKVTLKFKGKTYKAKTNKKGVATFKIKNNVLKKLKVGKKYKYKVTYLKNTVTKKITIKR